MYRKDLMVKKENEKRVRENGESPLDSNTPHDIKVSVNEPSEPNEKVWEKQRNRTKISGESPENNSINGSSPGGC